MDSRPVLETLAQLLPTLPEVEDQLVIFDSLVGVSEPQHRADAAMMLRDAAAMCLDDARRERLMKAADAVAAGLPCAFTPDGLSAQQAASAQTSTHDTPLPAAWLDESDEEEEEEDEDEEDFLREAPPELPQLPVRHFFDGLALRVAQNFTDANGRILRPGELLKLFTLRQTDDGYKLNLLVRSVQLTAGDAIHDAVLENAGNAWLQPVPSIDCLQELWEAVNSGLTDAEEDQKMDDHSEQLERLREDVDACADWLGEYESRGEPPECRSAALAARVFGRDSAMNARLRLLFAGVKSAPREE